MKKSKKLLFTGAAILSSFSLVLPLVASSCDNKLKKLNEYAKNEFKLKIDASKYAIKEALDITKYTNNLKNDYKFNLVEIKEENNKIVIRYTISDKNNKLTSNVFEQNFSGFKNSPAPIPKPEEKYDISKRNELLSLFNLEKDKLASKNNNKFTNDKGNANFKIDEVRVDEFNDLLGTMKVSIKGKYNNFDFSDEIEINDYKKPIQSLNQTTLNAKLNINKMIDEVKAFNDLKTMNFEQLLPYIAELTGLDDSNNIVNILDLLKNNNGYTSTFKFNNNDKFSLTIGLTYKVLNKNESSSKEETKEVVKYANREFEQVSYSDTDIANFLLTKIQEQPADGKSYASELVADFYRTGIPVAHSNIILPGKYENAYGADKIYISTENVGADDINGKVYFQYSVAIRRDHKIVKSTIKEVVIQGFKKITINTFQTFIPQIKGDEKTDHTWINIKKQIKKMYDEASDKDNFTITDPTSKAKFFRYLNGEDTWHVIREGTSLKDSSIFKENSHWQVMAYGIPLKDSFSLQTGLVNNVKYQIKNLSVRFDSIGNFKKIGNKLQFDFIFEFAFELNGADSATSQKNESLKKTATFPMDIED